MEDKHVLVSPLGNITIPEHLDLYSLLKEKMLEHRTKPAMVDLSTGDTYTYQRLQTMIEVVARNLHNQGVAKGSTLVLYGVNCVEYIFISLACIRLGVTMAAVNHLGTPGDLHRLIHLCKGEYIFTTSEVASKALEAAKNTNIKKVYCKEEHPGCISFSILLHETSNLSHLPSIQSLNINPRTDVACILFSSGTTGLPKAVTFSHLNLVASIRASINESICILEENNLIMVPLSHVYGLMLTLFNITCGSCFLLMKGFDLVPYLETIQKYKVKAIQVVPPVAVLLAKNPLVEKYDLTGVERIYCGAAPLAAEVEKEVMQKLKGPNLRFYQMYGMTETAGIVTISPKDGHRPKHLPPGPPGNVGMLAPGFQGKFVAIEDKQTLGPNQSGEFWVRSAQNMLGYQDNEEATRSTVTEDGWLKTGDIGYADVHGYVFITDRLKELIKYKAYQVAPAELEGLILSHPSVSDCGVIGLPDAEAGELPHAWVVKKEGVKLTGRDIQDFVAAKCAHYKKLRGGVKFVDLIPKTASGKILRREMKVAMNKAKL